MIVERNDVEGFNVITVRHDIADTRTWEANFLITADDHVDHAKSRLDLIKDDHARAVDIGAGIIKVGDVFCAMQMNGDPRKSASGLRPELMGDGYVNSMLEFAESVYGPSKSNFVMISPGNHETSYLSRHGVDLTAMLCNSLGCQVGGYQGLIVHDFRWRQTQQASTVWQYHHGGLSGGEMSRGALQFSRQMTHWEDVDLYLSGHIHESMTAASKVFRWDRRTRSVKGRVVRHVQVPTYKDEFTSNGYHIRKGRRPRPVGCVWAKYRIENDRPTLCIESSVR